MTFDIPVSGGNTASVHIPQQREHETTAFAEINKAALGLTYDSIAKVLTEIAPRYNYGYLGGFGYKATADRNVLDHPLESTIMARLVNKSDESWTLIYDNLTKMLPPSIAKTLASEIQKPLDEQNPSFIALQNLLQGTAEALANSSAAKDPVGVDSIKANHTALNLLVPFMALQNTLNNGVDVASSANKFLEEEGANFPNFDSYTKLLSNMATILKLTQNIENGLDDTPGGALNPTTQSTALKTTLLLSNLNEQISNVNPGNDLQIISDTLRSMEVILTAASLPSIQTGALYISLNTALFATSTKDSDLGFIGPDLNLVLASLSDGLAKSILPNKDQFPGFQLLSQGITFSLLMAIGLTALSVDQGYGPLPLNQTENGKASFFGFEILANLLAGSEITKDFYSSLIIASGGDEKTEKNASVVLAQVASLLMIYTAFAIHKNPSLDLFTDHTEELKAGLNAMFEILQKNNDELQPELIVALNQASIALENKDYDGLNEALTSFMESLGVSPDGIKEDFKAIGQIFGDSINVLIPSKDEEPGADVVNIV